MDSKEKILWLVPTQFINGTKWYGGVGVSQAMEEHAKEVAIDFAVWLKGGRVGTLWVCIGDNKWEALRPSKEPIRQEIITSEELYDLYLQSKK